jgi:guanylate kinase
MSKNLPTTDHSRGTLYIISAPSGAGKTSLVKALVQEQTDVSVSVSHTTRTPRPGEENGKHYFFVDKVTFERMREEGAFLEHAQVFDNFYGTSKAAVLQQLQDGRDVILEIDWQGAQQVRRFHPQSISIFILPPSRNELQVRLQGRGQDSADIINRRMKDAITEMSHYNEFDYLVINDDFQQALTQLRAILTARRQLRECVVQQHPELLRDLLDTA